MSRELRMTLAIIAVVLIVSAPLIFAEAPAVQPTASYLSLVFQSQPSPTPTALPTNTPVVVMPLVNGGFEQGLRVGWFPDVWVYLNENKADARSGNRSVYMGGPDSYDGSIGQQVTVLQSTPYLIYWAKVTSNENDCDLDSAMVSVDGDVLDIIEEFCNAKEHADYRRRVVDLRGYIGQTVQLSFNSYSRGAFISLWYIDDVSFVAKP